MVWPVVKFVLSFPLSMRITRRLTAAIVCGLSFAAVAWQASGAPPEPQVDYPPPTITGFSPTSTQAGKSIVLTGSNFFFPLSITFGGNVGAPSLAGSNTRLSVFVPSGAQSGPITVSAGGGTVTSSTALVVTFSHYPFFTGETALANGVFYLQLPNGHPFGYYSYLNDRNNIQNYIYHFDLGYEYVFDAADSQAGVYLYDFKSGGFFYTSPSFPFPYLYDFTLQSTVYYYPDPNDPTHYNTNGVRYFYVFNTGETISK